MTILTKPSSEKKSEKVPLPLAVEDVAITGLPAKGTLLSPQQRPYVADIDNESMVFNRRQHFTCIKTILLFLISVLVMMMGILGGYTLYRMYAPSVHSNLLHYRALCDIPYMSQDNMTLPRIYKSSNDMEFNWRNFLPLLPDDSFNNFGVDNNDYFREEIELDVSDDQSYAKIEVPDFKDGRRGRFMHDFKENQSAIIDTTTKRCFIMPLDRDTTLPPKNFLDLMQKMGSNYYNIDTDRVRRHMRVALPPVTDLTQISERIANECFDMKVYRLEKYTSGVFKREAIADAGKFAEFSGKGIVEFDLMNIADIDEFERKQQK